MTDIELLELAAKAAGIAIVPCGCRNKKWPFKHDEAISGKWGHWNPLEDDGDALRLAVKLGLLASAAFYHFRYLERFSRQYTDDITATRRAIVRSAVEVGKSMP